ncbi:MAG: hypothetical protein ACRCXQ_04335, partial [Vagococcus fluvialis]
IVFVFFTFQSKQLDISSKQVQLSNRQTALSEAQQLAYIELKETEKEMNLKSNGGANYSTNLKKNLIINTATENLKTNKHIQIEYIINLENLENLEFDELELTHSIDNFKSTDNSKKIIKYLINNDLSVFEFYEEILLSYKDKDLNQISNSWIKDISEYKLDTEKEISTKKKFKDITETNARIYKYQSTLNTDFIEITNLSMEEYDNDLDSICKQIIKFNEFYKNR